MATKIDTPVDENTDTLMAIINDIISEIANDLGEDFDVRIIDDEKKTDKPTPKKTEKPQKPVEKFTPTYQYDSVNHPRHYTEGRKYEPIDVIEDWGLSFNLGNTVKYISRAGRKDSTKTIEDLEKAKFYLEREIKKLKG